MRTRESVSTQGEFWISSMEHLHLWSSPQLSGGMGKECLMYHSRLAQLIAIKKGEQYAKTISWIRTRTSFTLLRSALFSLRGSRTRRVPCDIKNVDIDVEVAEGAIQSDYWCVSLLLNGKYLSITHWERYLFFFFSDFLIKNAIDLENSFFLKSKWIVLIEMKRF